MIMHLLSPSCFLLAIVFLAPSAWTAPSLSQQEIQLFTDRLWQTNLRGPRWTGNDNHNVLVGAVAESFRLAGLSVDVLDYRFNRWDPRWWSLTLNLANGSALGLPTTGYWPFSGSTGLGGITGPLIDIGSYSMNHTDETADNSTLDFTSNQQPGRIVFFDNPSPTRNYSAPLYDVIGTSHNIPEESIPELGNLTNPHWQSAKILNFTKLYEWGIVGTVSSWVNSSDENGALQWLPNSSPENKNATYQVPSLYVGNSTGELIRELLRNNEVSSARLVLDAPTYQATTQTVVGHLQGTGQTNDTIILYTHSDGPTIIEENGPILLLTIAEAFAKAKLSINLDFVITTGHISGARVNESAWMDQLPSLLQNAKAVIAAEHFGALEWKDDFTSGTPVYKATGQLEPMWTMANGSTGQTLHQAYIDAFEEAPEDIRMALIAPQTVRNTTGKWYGVGGAAILGQSTIPTIGIIPQPDYLWASLPDGGWSKLDVETAVEQINVILRLLASLDEQNLQGSL